MIVVDSSAILAVLQGETGAAVVDRHIDEAVLCAANLVEVIDRLGRAGIPIADAENLVDKLSLQIEPLTDKYARAAARLLLRHRRDGLSLGDCACLAVALTNNAPVLTTDKDWATLALGIDVRVIR